MARPGRRIDPRGGRHRAPEQTRHQRHNDRVQLRQHAGPAGTHRGESRPGRSTGSDAGRRRRERERFPARVGSHRALVEQFGAPFGTSPAEPDAELLRLAGVHLAVREDLAATVYVPAAGAVPRRPADGETGAPIRHRRRHSAGSAVLVGTGPHRSAAPEHRRRARTPGSARADSVARGPRRVRASTTAPRSKRRARAVPGPPLGPCLHAHEHDERVRLRRHPSDGRQLQGRPAGYATAHTARFASTSGTPPRCRTATIRSPPWQRTPKVARWSSAPVPVVVDN